MDQTKYKVYIGGLDKTITGDDLQSEFDRFGKTSNVWVAFKPPGFGFVEYDSKGEADAACEHMNGVTFKGCTLQVELSHGGRANRGGRGRGRGFGDRDFSDRSGGGYRGRGGGFSSGEGRGGFRRGGSGGFGSRNEGDYGSNSDSGGYSSGYRSRERGGSGGRFSGGRGGRGSRFAGSGGGRNYDDAGNDDFNGGYNRDASDRFRSRSPSFRKNRNDEDGDHFGGPPRSFGNRNDGGFSNRDDDRSFSGRSEGYGSRGGNNDGFGGRGRGGFRGRGRSGGRPPR